MNLRIVTTSRSGVFSTFSSAVILYYTSPSGNRCPSAPWPQVGQGFHLRWGHRDFVSALYAAQEWRQPPVFCGGRRIARHHRLLRLGSAMIESLRACVCPRQAMLAATMLKIGIMRTASLTICLGQMCACGSDQTSRPPPFLEDARSTKDK